MGQLSQKIQNHEENQSMPISPLTHNTSDVICAINRYNVENRLLLAQTAPMFNSGSPNSVDKYLHKKFKRLASAHGDDGMSTTSSIRSDTESSMFGSSEVESRRVPSLVPSPAMTEQSQLWNGHGSSNMRSDSTKPWSTPTTSNQYVGCSSQQGMMDLLRSHAVEKYCQQQQEKRRTMEQQQNNMARAHIELNNHQQYQPNNHHHQRMLGQRTKIKREDPEEEEVVVVDDNTDEDIHANAAYELYKKTVGISPNNNNQIKTVEKSLYHQSIMLRQQQQHLMQNHTNNKTGSESPFGRSPDIHLPTQPIIISSSSSTEDLHLLHNKRSPPLRSQRASCKPPSVITSASTAAAAAATSAAGGSKCGPVNVPGRYVCPYCSLNCSKPSVLRKHIRAHTNERPYPCVPCGFAFKTRSNLYKHFRLVLELIINFLSNIFYVLFL